jgi:hypothetical protein
MKGTSDAVVLKVGAGIFSVMAALVLVLAVAALSLS